MTAAAVIAGLPCVFGRGAGAEPPAEPPAVRRQLPTVRVVGLEMAELPEDPTSFTTVIDADSRRAQHETVSQLLGESVGVQVRQLGGPGAPSEISIRGSTAAQVVVQLDGLRLNNAQTGSFDLSAVPLAMLEQLQVSRGGGSLQAGSAAIGGVVNLVPMSPGDTPVTDASFAGGSFGSYEGSLSHARRIGKSDVVAGYDGFHTDGGYGFQSPELISPGGTTPSRSLTRINSESDRHVGWLRLGHDLDAGVRIGISDYLSYQSRGVPGLDSGSGADGGQNADAHQRVTRNLLDLKAQAHELWQGRVSAEGRLYARYDRSHYTDPTPVPNTGEPIDNLDDNWEVGLRAELATDLRWLSVDNGLSSQFEARHDSYSSNRALSQDRWVVSAMLQDEALLFGGRLSLAPGLRFEWAEDNSSEWLPRLGAALELVSGVRLKGNVERSYRIPTFDELFFDQGPIQGNPNLRPEEALNADLGFQLGFENWGSWLSAGSLEVAGFYNDIDNSIVFQQVNPFVVKATNTGPVQIVGVELAAALTLFEWFALSGNWTWLDSQLEGAGLDLELGVPRRVLPGRAKNQWLVKLVVGPPQSSARASFEAQHTGRIPTSFSGASFVSARTVFNAAISYDVAGWVRRIRQIRRFRSPGANSQSGWLPDQLILSLTGNNLTDQSVRDAVGFPQPGRTLTFQVKAKW